MQGRHAEASAHLRLLSSPERWEAGGSSNKLFSCSSLLIVTKLLIYLHKWKDPKGSACLVSLCPGADSQGPTTSMASNTRSVWTISKKWSLWFEHLEQALLALPGSLRHCPLKLRNVLPVKFCARHTQPMTSHARSWMLWRLQPLCAVQRCAWPLPSCVVARPEHCSSWETKQHAIRWVTLKKEPQLRIWLYPTWRIIKHGCGWKALKTIQLKTRHTVYSVKSNVASIDSWLISSHSYNIISCCILCSCYVTSFYYTVG